MWRVKKKKEDKKVQKVKTVSATGTVNVGVSSNLVNIGTSGLGGTVNVGHNSGVGATGTINLGVSAETVNIGTSKAGEVYLGNTGNSINIKSVNTYIGNTGLGATWIANEAFALLCPITLGAAPGLTTTAGSTGTFESDLLGNTQRINTTSLTISNYNIANVVASYYITKAGLYLATWSIQQQITTPPNGMTVNVAVNNTSITTTTGSLAFANWGMTKLTNIVFGSNGSVLFQTSALRYCNLVLTVDGGAGFSAPAITFFLTRLG